MKKEKRNVFHNSNETRNNRQELKNEKGTAEAMMTKEEALRKIREDDFFFSDESVIKVFGKEGTEELKRENPEYYCLLRDSPMGMPSDIITDDETAKHIADFRRKQ